VTPKDRDVAMVFQNYALYPYLTVAANIAFPLRIARVPKAERDRRVHEVATMLGLADYLERKPGQLSGGQRQRVAMGRAIIREPSVFLMDEPLSNLDAKLRVQMRVELVQLHRRVSTTTVYVTHDQVEAMTMGDRIVVMNDGVVQQIAPPKELYDHPVNRFVAGFIGSPPMNFLDAELVRDGERTYAQAGSVKTLVPAALASKLPAQSNGKIVLGIRPEDVRVSGNGETSAKGRVDVVELLGSEQLGFVVVGQQNLLLRTSPDTPLNAGDAIDLNFNVAKMHAFDPDSGAAYF
ncbi:MAG: ABC transporter ATP-binding protein, partial [Vulcanimicrobiaceae bacterium]